MIDTWIVNGTVVTERAAAPASIGIAAGRIAVLQAPDGPVSSGADVIDAAGLIVLPGAIDAHTHFTGSNPDPLGEVREGMKGALVGGVTTVLEMPHSNPPAVSLEAFQAKAAMMQANAPVDFALWAGLTNDNLDALASLHAAGAIAFKGFMCSGEEDGEAPEAGLPAMRDDALLAAMHEIARLGNVVGLHAENHALLVAARQAMRTAGRGDMAAHGECHPEIAELEAVSRAVLFAGESGVRCHIVHVSSARAAALIAAARDAGRRLSLETCPQYLLLDADDLTRVGPRARCGPALRPAPTVAALWAELEHGHVDIIASDHCPYLPESKQADSDGMWHAGMGLTGVETMTRLFFDAAVTRRGFGLTRFAELTATAPARLFNLYPRKGVIALGSDADLALYDPAGRWQVRGAEFHGHGTWSAFEGMSGTGAIRRVLQRGRTVYRDGEVLAAPGDGQWQRPVS